MRYDSTVFRSKFPVFQSCGQLFVNNIFGHKIAFATDSAFLANLSEPLDNVQWEERSWCLDHSLLQ